MRPWEGVRVFSEPEPLGPSWCGAGSAPGRPQASCTRGMPGSVHECRLQGGLGGRRGGGWSGFSSPGASIPPVTLAHGVPARGRTGTPLPGVPAPRCLTGCAAWAPWALPSNTGLRDTPLRPASSPEVEVGCRHCFQVNTSAQAERGRGIPPGGCCFICFCSWGVPSGWGGGGVCAQGQPRWGAPGRRCL